MPIKSDDQVLIKATNIHQRFGTDKDGFEVLRDVSFEIKHNTFNVIYGPSGSGKSTLLNILTGLQRPTRGTITFKDENIYNLKPDEIARFRAHRIGIVYQQNYWVQSLNVLENVAMPLYFLGYDRSLAADMAMIALERIEMAQYAKRYPIMLSGGEQQRIAMARAIVNDPLFIIADEPTGSLDSKNGDKIMNLLRKAYAEARRTIILVTHNMEYLPLADNLLHIQDGTVINPTGETVKATTDAMLADLKARLDEYANTKIEKAKL